MSKKGLFIALLALLGARNPTSAAMMVYNNNSHNSKVSVVPVKTRNTTKNPKGYSYPLSVSELMKMASQALEKKQYKTCIDLCDRVLITGSQKQYATACYILGRAHMGMNNYNKSIMYLELALKYYNEFGVSRPEKGVDYVGLYNDALTEAKNAREAAANAAQQVMPNRRK
ncbi:MAG: hypothetical protein K5912_01075 [Alphaproteobacteria bacterium]|nr:hypothetical protein [Alphaproteobacteria bacterium]